MIFYEWMQSGPLYLFPYGGECSSHMLVMVCIELVVVQSRTLSIILMILLPIWHIQYSEFQYHKPSAHTNTGYEILEKGMVVDAVITVFLINIGIHVVE